mgnify:CR=1 FL=1
MLPGTNSATNTTATSTPSLLKASQSAPQIDFQNFLKLLPAQLRHQDPLSPTESTQFVTQLASFSTVEQLVNANSKLDGIGDKLSNSGISDYRHLIGRTAETRAPVNDPTIQIPFRLAPEPLAQTADLVIRDVHGVEVARARVLNNDSVQQWPGFSGTISAANGPFSMTGEYFNNGQLINAAPASTFSTIKEVRSATGRVVVRLENGAEVALDDIIGLGE